MFKELFKFGKADVLMWAGIGIFSLILLIAFSVMTSNEGLIIKDLIGLVVVLILPGYVIVKLYFDQVVISENLTKNPDINKAVDKLIMSLGLSIATIIPMNFLWNYVLTMGGGEGSLPECAAGSASAANCKPEGGSNLWGNVDEELIYTGTAGLRSLFTVFLVLALAIGYKVYQVKFKK